MCMEWRNGELVLLATERRVVEARYGSVQAFLDEAEMYHSESGAYRELCGCVFYDGEACRFCGDPDEGRARRFLQCVVLQPACAA